VLHYPIRASGMGVFQFFLNAAAQGSPSLKRQQD
jgi:hypothetical protein